jgi:hypothetical protein
MGYSNFGRVAGTRYAFAAFSDLGLEETEKISAGDGFAIQFVR